MQKLSSVKNKGNPIFFVVEEDSNEIIDKKGQSVLNYGYLTNVIDGTEYCVLDGLYPNLNDDSWYFKSLSEAEKHFEKLKNKPENSDYSYTIRSIQQKVYTFFDFN